jgi:D-glycero-D-manno-heptose 1,7-bisphosphate phosphatase
VSSGSVIFLDRDGVLNGLVADARSNRPESPYSPKDVFLLPRAVEGLRRLQGLGVPLVVVSNQPAAAKGTATLDALRAVHDEVARQLRAAGVGVSSYHYCFHYDGGADRELGVACDCRKPAPGMLLDAARDLGIADLSGSWIIGDSDVDVRAGRAVGCRTVLIDEPSSSHRRSGDVEPDARAADLFEAAGILATVYASRGVLA